MIKKIARLHKAGTLGLAVKGEIGNVISLFGSAVSSPRLVYNPWTYAIFHRAALETSPAMVEGILGQFKEVKSAVDFGCGTGAYVSEFRKRGVVAQGFEYSPIARKVALEAFGIQINAFDLEDFKDAGGQFDLATSFEVAEHLTPEFGDRLVSACCRHAPLVVFSAAGPGQPGQGHIHLQPKSYWIERFARAGFAFNGARTVALEQYLRTNLFRGFWLADNIAVFESNEARV